MGSREGWGSGKSGIQDSGLTTGWSESLSGHLTLQLDLEYASPCHPSFLDEHFVLFLFFFLSLYDVFVFS